MSHRKLDSGVQVFGPIREAIEDTFVDVDALDTRVTDIEMAGGGNDPSKLPLAGGTMSGDINMDGGAVTNQLGMTTNTNDVEDERAQARAFACGADTTGVLTGGEVTINVDPTKFDVAGGTGVIIDWTGPNAPQRHFVRWAALVAQTVPNLATQFTSLYFNDSGTLVKGAGIIPNGNNYRSRIYLQSIIHQSGTQIESISSGSNPAYEALAALYDYIRFLGPLNKGNCFIPNGINLTFNKESGQTALPFINRANDLQNPTIQTDAAISPIVDFTYNYQDGGSGFTKDFPNSVIDPNFWDDGTGTLNSVVNNRFTIQRIYWFPQAGTVSITYGQAEYQTIGDARDAVLLETPNVDLLVSNNGSFTAALIVQQGATDLSDPTQADFICLDTF